MEAQRLRKDEDDQDPQIAQMIGCGWMGNGAKARPRSISRSRSGELGELLRAGRVQLGESPAKCGDSSSVADFCLSRLDYWLDYCLDVFDVTRLPDWDATWPKLDGQKVQHLIPLQRPIGALDASVTISDLVTPLENPQVKA